MKVAGVSKKALRFLGQNEDIRSSTDEHVMIRFVEIDNWLRVMIEVGEDTTSDALRKVIPLALEWRDRLILWQGPWQGGGTTPFFEELCRLHDRGNSYADIADRLNKKVAECLEEYYECTKAFQAVAPQFKTYLDFYLWLGEWMKNPDNPNPFGDQHARDILVEMRLPKEEIDEWIAEGLRRIAGGEQPFESGYPISRDKVIQQLRRWRGGKKHELLTQNDCD